jgi:cytochrome c
MIWRKQVKNLLKFGLLAAAIGFAGQAAADENLAMKSGCLACHKVDVKLVGPAYQEIAAKYKDQEGAQEMLTESVIKGSVNKWGPVPMPAKGGRADVSDEDIGKIVAWILTL